MSDADARSPEPRILARPGGPAIAYHKISGNSPGVVFLSGYMSDMTGTKALFVEEACRALGHACLRLDYSGHGASEGDFLDGTLGAWADDAIAALDELTEGPQVLVGSSMGGWIMLLVALARPRRIAGLVGIAAAPDFTEDLLAGQLSPEQIATMERDGVVYVPSEYGPEPTPFTRALIEDGKRHLVLRRRMPLACPVRLIHGMADSDVPWQTSLRISQMIESDDVEIQLVKAGAHRLSEPAELARLERTLAALLDRPA